MNIRIRIIARIIILVIDHPILNGKSDDSINSSKTFAIINAIVDNIKDM